MTSDRLNAKSLTFYAALSYLVFSPIFFICPYFFLPSFFLAFPILSAAVTFQS